MTSANGNSTHCKEPGCTNLVYLPALIEIIALTKAAPQEKKGYFVDFETDSNDSIALSCAGGHAHIYYLKYEV